MIKQQKDGAIYIDEINEQRDKARRALEKAKLKEVGKIPVRINKTILIFIKQGQCPIEARERFIKRMGLK